jgi:hypothetical protein
MEKFQQKPLDIPDIIIESAITIFGIMLLLITFLISVTLRMPQDLNDIVKFSKRKG